MKALVEKLACIQRSLKAPKNQYNTFGKYKYRNCEDILEAAKPLLEGLVLTLADDIQCVGERVYVKATVSLTDGEHTISNTAFAREAENKKGMDESQITGTASSYARKYALNGLFCIDDTKDADSMNNDEAPTVSAKSKPVKAAEIHPVQAVANELGITLQDVFNTFNPPITSLQQVADIEGCIQFLRQNIRKAS